MRKKVADNAVARITEALVVPSDKVSAGYTHINAIKASPSYVSAKGVQTATVAWNAETDNLAAINQEIADLLNKLETARANQATSVRRWNTLKLAVLSAITTFSDGSKDLVHSFGMGVAERTPAPPAITPQDLLGKRSKQTGAANVTWKAQPSARGYVVQHAADPANAATYSPPALSFKAKFELTGQTPGVTIYFRVAALDDALPAGQTDYTPWVAAVVST